MTAVGELALWTAFLLAVWGTVAGSVAARGDPARNAPFAESAARALWANALLLALALAGVVAALLAPDFGFTFIVGSTSLSLPSVYRLAALMSRPEGSLLTLAFAIALVGAPALRAARRADAAARPALAAALCAAVLLPLAGTVLAADPYVRAAAPAAEGFGLSPAWQNLTAPIARAALVIAAAVFAVALAQRVARRAARRWWLAAWGLGALALMLMLRRSLSGTSGSPAEWAALSVWLVLSFGLHRRRDRARLAAHLAHAGAVVALIAAAGFALRAEHRVLLAGSVATDVRDPLGRSWRFTSEGLSSYDELNRHVAAVLVDATRGNGRVRVLRTEWRQYVDAEGEPLGAAVPVAAVLNGLLTSVVVELAAPPRGDDGVFVVRFVPFFAWWWLAAGLMIAAALLSAVREPSP